MIYSGNTYINTVVNSNDFYHYDGMPFESALYFIYNLKKYQIIYDAKSMLWQIKNEHGIFNISNSNDLSEDLIRYPDFEKMSRINTDYSDSLLFQISCQNWNREDWLLMRIDVSIGKTRPNRIDTTYSYPISIQHFQHIRDTYSNLFYSIPDDKMNAINLYASKNKDDNQSLSTLDDYFPIKNTSFFEKIMSFIKKIFIKQSINKETKDTSIDWSKENYKSIFLDYAKHVITLEEYRGFLRGIVFDFLIETTYLKRMVDKKPEIINEMVWRIYTYYVPNVCSMLKDDTVENIDDTIRKITQHIRDVIKEIKQLEISDIKITQKLLEESLKIDKII